MCVGCSGTVYFPNVSEKVDFWPSKPSEAPSWWGNMEGRQIQRTGRAEALSRQLLQFLTVTLTHTHTHAENTHTPKSFLASDSRHPAMT